MIQKRLAITSLLLIVGMVVLNSAADMFYWYASIPWYDMMMHTFGGVFLAVFAGAVFTRHIIKLSRYETLVTILLIVMIVGLGWEFYEYTVQYVIKGSAQLASVPDSVSDIVCDLIGGVVGVFFVLNQKKRYNDSHE